MSLNGKKIWIINKFLYLCGMKKILYIFLIVLLGFTSCKKEKHEYHKITFEITFLDEPKKGSSNFIDITCSPRYVEKPPTIDRFNIPKIWRYDYLDLEKGQKVYFYVAGQLSYHFEMKIYLDGVETSYSKIKVDDYSYYVSWVEESRGRNDKPNESVIEFTY